MLPRSKPSYCKTAGFAIALISFILLLSPISMAREKGNPMIRFYQKVISPVDGDRCIMRPSCSRYAAQAVEKHGWLVGWMMACDRIQRCGRDTVDIVPKIDIDGVSHAYDPLGANDFWWVDKKEAKQKK